MSVVSVKKVDAYTPELLDRAVAEHFEALGIAGELRTGMRVTIKPNLLLGRKPDSATTTHPELIAAIIRLLKKSGISVITVADSPGGLYTPAALKAVYSACGYNIFEEHLNFDCSFREVHTPENYRTRSFNIITPLLDTDYIINVAKLKTHSMTGISAGIKNLFGSIPGLQKPEMHYRNPDLDDFSGMLLELSRTVAPQLTLIDGIDGMEGNGPSGGDKRHMGILLASKDLYAQDWEAAKLMGLDPESISMLRQARERGLFDPKEIELIGDNVFPALPPFKLPDTKTLDFTGFLPAFLKKPAAYIMRKLLKPLPNVKTEKCIGCGKCAESCPQQIITITNRKAVINKKTCISCFCCQEMCPAHAIEVKRKLKF